MILDEPTNGLDPAGTRDVRGIIAELHAGGATVVVSSHLLTEVEATCTHVAVLQSGSLIAEGELRRLLNADATGLVVTTPDTDLAVATLRGGRSDAYRDDADEPAVVVPAGDAPEVIALLVRAGVAVQEARRRRPRLEELFARLTERRRECRIRRRGRAAGHGTLATLRGPRRSPPARRRGPLGPAPAAHARDARPVRADPGADRDRGHRGGPPRRGPAAG